MDFRRRQVQPGQATGPRLGAGLTGSSRVGHTSPRERQQLLRSKPRHAGMLEALRRLDAALDDRQRGELADWVRQEYERELGDAPLGFVTTCWLGPPYVEHRLSLAGSIVDHFAANQPMPDPFQGARMLVRSGAYEAVEVYLSGQLIPVRADGTPVPGTPAES